MDFTRLTRNVEEMIAEQQLKLGYMKESVRLYYPLDSLNSLMTAECNGDEMQKILCRYFSSCEEKYGKIQITRQNERFCLIFPPETGEYVHRHIEEYGFLKELVELVGKHGCTWEEVKQVFEKYSSNVKIKKIHEGEFDYLLYFPDGRPDDFMYCINIEEEHVTYHRFTRADYRAFGWDDVEE